MYTGRMAAAALLVLASVASGAASASPSVAFGLSAWDAQAAGAGTTAQGGAAGSTVDLQSDLGMRRHWASGAYFVWRHGLPFAPDLMLGYDHVFNDGDAYLNRTITWQGTTYQANGRILSQAELKDGRVVVFWNPLDNAIVNLRIGLEARWLSLRVPLTGTVRQGANSQQESVSAGDVGWLPLANVGLIFHLPGHVALAGEWSYVRYSTNYLSDYRAGVAYAFATGVVLSAGWREFHLRLRSSRFEVKGDLEFKGIYAGVGYRF